MHIYIDESGVFSNPSNKPNVASVVVALTVPSSCKVQLFNEFRKLALELPTEDGEVKGRLLDESHVARASALLGKYDCIVEINAIDIAFHTEDQLKEYQTAICDAIAGWATAERPEEFKNQVAEVAAALKKPKSPLFVESFLLMVLVPRILEVSMNYYSRRIPRELQSYHWVVDGKDIDVTAFEKAWYTVIFPSIEHQSKQKPFEKFLNGDYSYLEPFYTLPTRKAARAKAELGDDLDKVPFDIEPILQDFKFQNSKDNLGLQMADVVANATQRALNGRLKEDGYLGIGKLMVINNEPALRFCLLDPKAQEYGPVKVPSPFYATIDKMLAQRKPMQASPEQEAYLERRAKRRRKKQLGYCKAFSEIFRP